MTEPLIYSVGTQVVVQKETYHVNRRVAHPAGSVGVNVRSPIERTHTYRVKFNDGFEAAVHHDRLIRLSAFQITLQDGYQLPGGPGTVSGRKVDPKAGPDLVTRSRSLYSTLPTISDREIQTNVEYAFRSQSDLFKGGF